MKMTTLCYIEQAGKYLMLHRISKKNDENHDKWIGIGGKFEAGESPEDCVVREALEETGLTLIKPSFRGIVTFVSDEWGTEYMHLFTAKEFTGELIACDEGEQEWVDIPRVMELSLWEGDKIFLKLLGENRAFFSLKLCYQGEKLIAAVLDGEPLNLA